MARGGPQWGAPKSSGSLQHFAGAKAAGADPNLFHTPVHHGTHLSNIGTLRRLGLDVGVADLVSNESFLSTDIARKSHLSTSNQSGARGSPLRHRIWIVLKQGFVPTRQVRRGQGGFVSASFTDCLLALSAHRTQLTASRERSTIEALTSPRVIHSLESHLSSETSSPP